MPAEHAEGLARGARRHRRPEKDHVRPVLLFLFPAPPTLTPAPSPRSASAKTHEPLRLVLAPGATPASALYSSLAQAAFPNVVQAGHLQPDLNSAAAPVSKSPLTLNVDTTLGAAPPSSSSSSASSPSPSAARAAPASASPGGAGSLTAQRFARLPIGSRIEVSPSSWEVARDTARLVGGTAGGAGLVVDYGDAKAFGRSWRVRLLLSLVLLVCAVYLSGDRELTRRACRCRASASTRSSTRSPSRATRTSRPTSTSATSPSR